jgi:hypothetical protein
MPPTAYAGPVYSIYSHVMPGMDEQAAELVAEREFG